MSEDALVGRVAALLDDLTAAVGPGPAAAELVAARTTLAGPLRVAVAGWMKAGKSTLLNALLGEPLAPTDAGECTRVLTEFRYGPEPAVAVVDAAGVAHPRPPHRDARGALDIDLDMDLEAVRRLEVAWPLPALAGVSYLDTPGLESPTPGLAARARRALLGELAGDRGVDAVIYLMRHLHASDVAFLEAFAVAPRSDSGPVNAVGVLARADEVGGGRLDAPVVAERVAARYRRDPRLRRLVQTVVPVNGLLAVAAGRLGEGEVAALGALAQLPGPRRAAVLRSAELLVAAPDLASVSPIVRAELIRHLGPFGVRMGAELLAAGEVEPDVLGVALRAASGIDGLRGLLQERFAARAGALSARSALAVAERVASGQDEPVRSQLLGQVEEVVANAPQLAELGALNLLRLAPPRMPAALLDEAEGLLGGFGTAPAERLGLGRAAGPDEVAGAALAAADRWRALSESPWGDVAATRLARVALRACEGMVAEVAPPT